MGKRWGTKEFAEAVGRTPRTVNNWLINTHLGPDTDSIERALFGDDPTHCAEWRVALRFAHHASASPVLDNKLIRPFFGVPPQIAGFTGRADKLAQLAAALAGASTGDAAAIPERVAVIGLPGIGKTSVATEYAHRSRHRYAGVWWCSAESRTSLVTNLSALARTLGVSTKIDSDIETAAKVALQYLGEHAAKWLLVYDNVAVPSDVVDLLPGPGPQLLITSRFSDWKGWTAEIQLDLMALHEAADFLQRRSGLVDQTGALRLAKILGRLPLALDHAAAICGHTQKSFSNFATEVSRLISRTPRGVAYPRSVAATFDLAIGDAVAREPLCDSLIAFLAYCAPERIPIALLRTNRGRAESEVLLALSELSLIRHDPFPDGMPAVTVHRLVQAVARARASKLGIAKRALDSLVAGLENLFPENGYSHPKSWPLCAKLVPHVLELVRFDRRLSASIHWGRVLSRAASYLHGRASYVEAHKMFERALKVRERSLGRNHEETAATLNDFGLLFRRRGDNAKARKLYERALKIRIRQSGPAHAKTAETLNNLAVVDWAEGQFARSVRRYRRVLTIKKRVLGGSHPDTARTMNNLAVALHDQGKLAEAEGWFRRSLSARKKRLGLKHPDTAETMNNLAYLLIDRKKLKEAESLLTRAVRIWLRTLGNDHPHTNSARTNLAQVYLMKQDTGRGLALARQAMKHSEVKLGSRHASTKRAAIIVLAALHGLGQKEEAELLRAKFDLDHI